MVSYRLHSFAHSRFLHVGGLEWHPDAYTRNNLVTTEFVTTYPTEGSTVFIKTNIREEKSEISINVVSENHENQKKVLDSMLGSIAGLLGK